MSKRCAYHQGLGHDTDRCYNLCHAIQDLIETKVIAPPIRPSITNNPLPNHNFGKEPRSNCLMSKWEGEEDPSKLIYDLPKCFIVTLEKLMGMTFAIAYDIWSKYTTWGETLQTPIKWPNTHIEEDTLQTLRHWINWPIKNCPHHKGGDISNPHIWRQTIQ